MNRQSWLVIIMMLLMCYITLHGWQLMSARKAAAESAGEDLGKCRRYAAAIRQLRKKPQIADGQEDLADNIRRIAQETAQAADIPSSSLKAVRSESPSRLGETAYKDKPTRIRLLKVTPRQAVKFVHALTNNHGLHPKAIEMAVPDRNSTENLWTVDIVVTYLIYDPPSADR
jgi:hypothetical protein